MLAIASPGIISLMVVVRLAIEKYLATQELQTAKHVALEQKKLLEERRPPTAPLPDLLVSAIPSLCQCQRPRLNFLGVPGMEL